MRIVILLIFSLSLWANSTFIKQAYYDSYNYEKMQNYADAIKSLKVVYEKYPKAYTPNFRLGWLFYLNKNYADAIKHYQVAISVVASSAEAKLGLIQVYQAMGKHDDAKRLIYDILQNDVYNYFANAYLVSSLNATQEYKQSLKIIYKMLAFYPTDVYFLEKLAQVYVYQKKASLSKDVYENIIILDPSNTKAIGYLNE